jgi:hypothetical protein
MDNQKKDEVEVSQDEDVRELSIEEIEEVVGGRFTESALN